MKVVVAIDSFKGSLTTVQAGNAVANGIKRVFEDAEVIVCPLADGGEGTVNALTLEDKTNIRKVKVHNPLGKMIDAYYGVTENNIAVIEMAIASGITLIDDNDKNPLKTTTYGVGELIKDAVDRGYRDFIIGIGGSATNDCGVGMLQALGFEFLDSFGNQVEYGANGVKNIRKIKTNNVIPELSECTFNIACDVSNILCGENGCSYVYGPQKGATLEMVKDMDNWILKFAELSAEFTGKDNKNYPGAGAAGGLGFAFLTYLNGKLESGINLVIRETKLEEKIRGASCVITGEGRLDNQTCMGKAPVGVASIAKKYNIPVIAFSGCVTDGAKSCNQNGIDAYFPIVKGPCSLEEAMDTDGAYNNLADTSEQVFNILKFSSYDKK